MHLFVCVRARPLILACARVLAYLLACLRVHASSTESARGRVRVRAGETPREHQNGTVLRLEVGGTAHHSLATHDPTEAEREGPSLRFQGEKALHKGSFGTGTSPVAQKPDHCHTDQPYWTTSEPVKCRQ